MAERADGKWIATIELPKRLDGSRHRKVREFATKKAAFAGLRKLQDEARSGNLSSANVKLNSLIDAYLDDGLHDGIRGITRAGYHYNLKHYVGEVIGARKLADITPALVMEWRKSLAQRGLSKRTIQMSNQQFAAMFDWARVKKFVNHNPVDEAGDVTQGKPKRPTVRLAEQEARAYLEAAYGGPDDAQVHVLLGLALRRSEAVGMRWSDLDLDEGLLHIERGVTEYKSETGGTSVDVNAPKTEMSRRTILLPSWVVASLLRQRTAQQGDRERAGAAWTETGYVFANAVGALPYPTTLSSRFKRFRIRHGLPVVPLRDLRHSAAHLMMEAGAPIDAVSESLGHSSIKVTKDIYVGKVARHAVELRDKYESFIFSEAAASGDYLTELNES